MTTSDESVSAEVIRQSTKWNFVRSNVVPSNVTLSPRLTANSQFFRGSEVRGSALRPAVNPAAWYESPDRSKPSVSSF